MWFIWVVTPLGQKRIRPEERKPGLWAQLELNLAGNFQGKHGLPLGIKESMARNISSSNPVPISWGFSGRGGIACPALSGCTYAHTPQGFQGPKSLHQWNPGTVDKDMPWEQKARAASIDRITVYGGLSAMAVARIRGENKGLWSWV